MKTWDDYKHYIQAVDTDAGQDLDEIEEQAAIISTMIQQRHALGLSEQVLPFVKCPNLLLPVLNPLRLLQVSQLC